jgi:putative transposase
LFNSLDILAYQGYNNTKVEILQGFKTKLILSPEQSQDAQCFASLNRLVYNKALEQRILAYQMCRKTLYYQDQANELPELKEAFPFLKQAPSQTFQQTLLDLQKAYDNFFSGVAGFPVFHRKHCHNSFRFPTPTEFQITRLSKRKGSINLPKLGVCKFWWHSQLPVSGEPRSATISKEAGNWYLSILYVIKTEEPEVITAQTAKTAIAVDRGCNNLVGLSHPVLEDAKGSHLSKILEIDVSGYLGSLRADVLKFYDSQILRLQRLLSKKKKGSKAFSRLKTRLSKLHRHLRNYRLDALHQLSRWLVDNHDIIVLEDLDVQAMTVSHKGTLEKPGVDVARKASLNKNILQQGWGYLRIFLAYKLKWLGKLLIDDINPAYTSQQCFNCGYIDERNRVREEFFCWRCLHEDHADINASKNVLRAGLARLAPESWQSLLPRFLGTIPQALSS